MNEQTQNNRQRNYFLKNVIEKKSICLSLKAVHRTLTRSWIRLGK